jgi:hypothetical protein
MNRVRDIGGEGSEQAPGLLRRTAALATAAIGCGLAAVVLLVAGARWGMPGSLAGPVAGGGWTSRSRAWFTADGFFPAEVAQDTGRTFSWTGGVVKISVGHLNRGQAYRLALTVVPGRPADASLPALRLAVDGAVLASTEPSNDRHTLEVEIPPRAAPGTAVTLDVSNTFVPSSSDRRSLGVVVEDISLSPVGGHFRPDNYVATRAGLAVMAAVCGLLLCGLRSRLAAFASGAVVAGFTLLLLHDGAFLGTYLDRLIGIGIGVALAGVVIRVARWRWPGGVALPEGSIAAGVVLGASAIKLALFAHPLATVGDGIFQLHRAQLVRAGTYFYTSITPRPFFEFPYPIALYVTAQPFWRFFPAELDQVFLLRGLSLVADAMVGVALYAAARRQWNSRTIALLAAALWPFAPGPFHALNNANLTNVFGQGLFGAAAMGIAWLAAGTRMSLWAWLATAAFLGVAFLSHFSTVSVGVPICCVVGVLLIAAGRGHLRRVGIVALAVTLAVGAVSYGVYYSHFTDVYRKTLARVASGEGEAPTRSIVAPPAVKAQRWITGQTDDYGLPNLPALAIAVAGAVMLGRQRRREGFTRVLAGWAIVWAGFTALGIFSTLAMRVNLAAAPVFIALAAYALGSLAVRSRVGVMLACAGALIVAWDGLRVGLLAIGLTPPF